MQRTQNFGNAIPDLSLDHFGDAVLFEASGSDEADGTAEDRLLNVPYHFPPAVAHIEAGQLGQQGHSPVAVDHLADGFKGAISEAEMVAQFSGPYQFLFLFEKIDLHILLQDEFLQRNIMPVHHWKP